MTRHEQERAQNLLAETIGADWAREAISQGARAPWGEGLTMHDEHLFWSEMGFRPGVERRAELLALYDRAFRATIDAEAAPRDASASRD